MPRSPSDEAPQRGDALEAARRFEAEGRLDEAARTFAAAGRHWDAGRVLFDHKKFVEAARMYLRDVPADWAPRLGADRDLRRALQQAAVAFARAGDVERAAALLIALDERDRAADLMQRAGRKGDATSIRLGHDIKVKPWAETVDATGGGAADPFAAAQEFLRAGRGKEAIAELQQLPPQDGRYRAAARLAARLAAQHGFLSFELDHWLGTWLRGRGALAHERADVEPLYGLGKLYAEQGMVEAAEACLKAVDALHPDFRDVTALLSNLWKKDAVADAVLGKIADEDRRFWEAQGKKPFGAVGGLPEPASLPSLPDLPMLPALPPLEALEPAKPAAQYAPSTGGGAAQDETATQDLSMQAGHREDRPPREGPPSEARAGREGPPSEARSGREGPPSEARGDYRGGGDYVFDPRSMVEGDPVTDRYIVERKLGQGGMGVVYRVRDLMLEETVAMKLFFKDGPTDLQRFKDELKICRRLAHPNVLRTFEFGAYRSAHFLTMELLSGDDLDGLLRKVGGPLPTEQGLQLMLQAADGLGAAHRLQIVHRDIKPQNLFVEDDGKKLKITDFGIAKSQRSEASLTATGMLVGSPAYIAPERIRGDDDIDGSSDLYALGVVMYQVFTGDLPFKAKDIPALFMQHIQAIPTPPRRLNPSLPPAVEAVVLRLLEKEPAQRYAHARGLRSALEDAWRSMMR